MKYKIHSAVFKRYVLLVITLATFKPVDCEMFSSTDVLKNLLKSHENVMVNLGKYIEAEETRLNNLKSYHRLFIEEHIEASESEQLYVQNPINAFTLIKRLSKDFDDIKNYTSQFTVFEFDQELEFPAHEDLRGAAVAMARLQLFYKLNTTDLANGKLNDNVIGLPMSSADCKALAVELFNYGAKEFLDYIAEWFTIAYENLLAENATESELTEVLSYIVLTYHRINEKVDPTAFEWSKMLFELDPEQEFDGYLKFYREVFVNETTNTIFNWDSYQELCRGKQFAIANSSKLHCSYLRRNPFLRLAPIKMEKVSYNPAVFLFHDVVSDDEMEQLKQMALPGLQRAMVFSATRNTSKVVDGRVGQNILMEDDNDLVHRLLQRAADFTGLDMSMNEVLQVLNYGMGGHYNIHFDASLNATIFGRAGNRIGTVLLYLSDVNQGGSTVFPDFYLSVKPEKGAAVYWRNLHHDGQLDQRMYHAGCPVLHGSKWVTNIWFREFGNELKWPCGTTESHSINFEENYENESYRIPDKCLHFRNFL